MRHNIVGRYGIPDNPALTTQSRFRKWWLYTVWGYKVLEIRRKPRAGWFGRVAYQDTYLMLPKN